MLSWLYMVYQTSQYFPITKEPGQIVGRKNVYPLSPIKLSLAQLDFQTGPVSLTFSHIFFLAPRDHSQSCPSQTTFSRHQDWKISQEIFLP